jgi:hypothetical protein
VIGIFLSARRFAEYHQEDVHPAVPAFCIAKTYRI